AKDIAENPEKASFIEALWRRGVTLRRYGKSRLMPAVPFGHELRFLWMYVMKLGILDGRAGWRMARFMSNYQRDVHNKLKILRANKDNPDFTDEDLERQARPEQLSGAVRAIAETPDGAPYTNTSIFAQKRAERGAAPTLVEVSKPGMGTAEDKLRYVSPWTLKQKILRVLWMFTSKLLFRTSFHNLYGWRRMLLRLFGARIGKDVRIRPTTHVEIPWNITIGDGTVVGDHAILYSLGHITVGRRSVISQYAHLCAGTHDYFDRTFPLLRPPITIGDNVWVAADAFVGPDVEIGDNSVIGARSSVFKKIPANVIAAGNPARPLKERVFNDEDNSVVNRPLDKNGKPIETSPATPANGDDS
ncbi:MAG: WcaF family extracellular polysaccharide biosynthesis acetyltransferase, partial [Planctomycetota bacterium]